MEKFVEIRAPESNALYGMLDLHSYTLHIKENKNTRIIPIPKKGLKLQFISFSDRAEDIDIPPQEVILTS